VVVILTETRGYKIIGRGWIMSGILRTAARCAIAALFLCGGCSDTDEITLVGGGKRPSIPMESCKPPSVPTDVVATAISSDSVTVRWSRVPEATGYYVYRGTSVFKDGGYASDMAYIRWVVGTTTTITACSQTQLIIIRYPRITKPAKVTNLLLLP
jgi:hypothetical protein